MATTWRTSLTLPAVVGRKGAYVNPIDGTTLITPAHGSFFDLDHDFATSGTPSIPYGPGTLYILAGSQEDHIRRAWLHRGWKTITCAGNVEFWTTMKLGGGAGIAHYEKIPFGITNTLGNSFGVVPPDVSLSKWAAQPFPVAPLPPPTRAYGYNVAVADMTPWRSDPTFPYVIGPGGVAQGADCFGPGFLVNPGYGANHQGNILTQAAATVDLGWVLTYTAGYAELYQSPAGAYGNDLSPDLGDFELRVYGGMKAYTGAARYNTGGWSYPVLFAMDLVFWFRQVALTTPHGVSFGEDKVGALSTLYTGDATPDGLGFAIDGVGFPSVAGQPQRIATSNISNGIGGSDRLLRFSAAAPTPVAPTFTDQLLWTPPAPL